MPPEDEGDPLTAEQIGLLRAWIDQGLVWPDELAGDSGGDVAATPLWSIQPVRRPQLPLTDDPWISSPIDALVLARLRAQAISPSSPADRTTLIRRVYLDLLGLPPPPEAVAHFVDDPQPNAYERLVDQVLASPRYGERWAQHWLDVVRYGESDGFETNHERPNAHPYRDYVISAWNDDKPYDRFIVEQLAGDTTGADAATGFLVAGARDIVRSPDPGLTLMQRQDELADMINTIGTAFLGLTLGCARCHNHKFDPISQKDYYAMQAVLAGVQHGERPLARVEASETVSQITPRSGVPQSPADEAAPAVAYAGVFQAAGPTHRLYRGDPMAPREEVDPDGPAVRNQLGGWRWRR
jgi:hypothetical protein